MSAPATDSGDVQPTGAGSAPIGARFRDVAARVRAAVDSCVGGVRLAPGCGVTDGAHCMRSPALEALLGAHPQPMRMSSRMRAHASHALEHLGRAVRVSSAGSDHARLERTGAHVEVTA